MNDFPQEIIDDLDPCEPSYHGCMCETDKGTDEGHCDAAEEEEDDDD